MMYYVLYLATLAIRNLVDALVVKCIHPHCNWTGARSTRASHVSQCEEEVIPCINGKCRAIIRAKEHEEHLKICKFYECKHADIGCPFLGTKSVVSKHSPNCVYGLMVKLEKRVVALEKELHKCDDEISRLNEQIRITDARNNSSSNAMSNRVQALEAELFKTRNNEQLLMNKTLALEGALLRSSLPPSPVKQALTSNEIDMDTYLCKPPPGEYADLILRVIHILEKDNVEHRLGRFSVHNNAGFNEFRALFYLRIPPEQCDLHVVDADGYQWLYGRRLV